MSRILLTALGLTTLTACDDVPSANSTTELANPAATFCVESGAQYEIRDGDNGQTGVCILPDGREVDAWEYFRENSPT
ncbi:putative hemolysin [Ruegeria sp. SCP11]|uniref:putative hemolysin n=1 Tax=Ruegeria sp. SCP11 TaxID=3141378 RepID=UPI0033372D08